MPIDEKLLMQGARFWPLIHSIVSSKGFLVVFISQHVLLIFNNFYWDFISVNVIVYTTENCLFIVVVHFSFNSAQMSIQYFYQRMSRIAMMFCQCVICWATIHDEGVFSHSLATSPSGLTWLAGCLYRLIHAISDVNIDTSPSTK